MKKTNKKLGFKRFLTAAISSIMMLSMIGCGGTGTGTIIGGGEVIKSIDTTKTQIYVEVFDGGYGREWIDKVAEDFEKVYTDYEIVVTPATTDLSVIYNSIAGGYTTMDMFFTCDPMFTREMIDRDLLVDLTDVYNTKIDGADKKSIKEKTLNYDIYKSMWGKGNAIYSMPYGDSINGMVFNYDYFVSKNYLIAVNTNDSTALSELTSQGISYKTVGNKVIFESSTSDVNYEEGDAIMSKGKDGKYGTYDDGQPITVSEWEEMLEKMVANGDKPFIWTGEYADLYTLPQYTSLFAQYEGIDNFNLFYTLQGTETKTGKTITYENGYDVYDMEGLGVAMDFFGDYFYNTRYKHSATTLTSVGGSHTDAQNTFILGYQTSTNPCVLFDGLWWEKEAKGTFDLLASRGDTDRAYGVQDYRYLLFPEIEGQYGLDGQGNGSVLTATDTGNVYIVKKSTDTEELLKVKKEFLAWTCKDEYLRYFTQTTSSIRPFEYELTSEEKSKMTIFGRNVWEMLTDRENIGVVRPILMQYSTMYAYGTKSGFYTSEMGNQIIGTPMEVINKGLKMEDYVAGMKVYYQRNWETYMTKLQNSGMYNKK